MSVFEKISDDREPLQWHIILLLKSSLFNLFHTSAIAESVTVKNTMSLSFTSSYSEPKNLKSILTLVRLKKPLIQMPLALKYDAREHPAFPAPIKPAFMLSPPLQYQNRDFCYPVQFQMNTTRSSAIMLLYHVFTEITRGNTEFKEFLCFK